MIFCIFTFMRKYMLILAIGTTLVLTACGSGSTATETKDSTATTVDTTSVVADTTAPKADDSVAK
jgi:ABC-type glycerol-3-phosphate transport system substrate-binding protein